VGVTPLEEWPAFSAAVFDDGAAAAIVANRRRLDRLVGLSDAIMGDLLRPGIVYPADISTVGGRPVPSEAEHRRGDPSCDYCGQAHYSARDRCTNCGAPKPCRS
jgi:hypothetical protein